MSLTIASLFQITYSGLYARERELEVISHNIANLQTAGYKRSQAITEDEVLPGAERALERWLPGGTYLAATRRLFQQGTIETTGQTWDLALDGPGFFQIQQPDGTIAYTRSGSFRTDQTGRLVTADGMWVLPPIVIPADTREVYVDRNGAVLAQVNGQVQQIGVLELARFANPEGLLMVGANRYIPTAASGPAQVARAGSPGYAEIVARALERSNVDLSAEMTALVSVQRAYSLALRMLQMTDHMHKLALELRV
ncbi:MAG: flagellar hook-basal body complex protein [Anaerolineae bacterium]|nr:flagellar hook-basal body complex protein [Anaerolineae bacterium]MDW8099682.1 flagellar hook-basal body complex protein [Anaerolineae bacterium]